MTINKAAFVQLIEEDIAWLEKQPRTLEREHILVVLRAAPAMYYPVAPTGERQEGRT